MTTGTRVAAATVHHLAFGRLDAGGARLRLRALHVMGHGSARIARAVGVREETIQRLVRGDARTISPQLRDAISDLYDAWWDKRAPGTHPRRTCRGGPASQDTVLMAAGEVRTVLVALDIAADYKRDRAG